MVHANCMLLLWTMAKKPDKGKPGSRPLEGDDLFHTVMRSAEPLDRTVRRRFVDIDPLLDGTSIVTPPGKPARTANKSGTMTWRPPSPESVSSSATPQEGFDRGTLRQVKQGKISVDARLDLHGLTQAQAHMRLNRFIESSARSGKRCVLIITGKGAPDGVPRHGFLEGSPRGVLRRMTPAWLSARGLAPYVVDYQSALPRDGGDGALYVRLRKLK
jgi:DNA-nicking Smr family endonuclease